MNHVVQLFSSGLDSYVLYRLLLSQKIKVTPVYIDVVNNNPAREAEISRLPANAKIVRLEGWQPGIVSKSGDLSGAIYVPGRNMVFSILAATAVPCDELVLGALKEETHAGMTDKNWPFATMTAALLTYVMSPFREGPVKVAYPLAERGITKQNIMRLAKNELGITVEELVRGTVSCYFPHGTRPCGNCKQCLRRVSLFYPEGEIDDMLQDPFLAADSRAWLIATMEGCINAEWKLTELDNYRTSLTGEVGWTGVFQYVTENHPGDAELMNLVKMIPANWRKP